jgi:hypothetical protein
MRELKNAIKKITSSYVYKSPILPKYKVRTYIGCFLGVFFLPPLVADTASCVFFVVCRLSFVG